MTTPPLQAPQASEPKPSRTKLWLGGAAAAALTLGIAVPVLAESGEDEPRLAEPASSTVVVDADEMSELDGGFVDEIAPEELGDDIDVEDLEEFDENDWDDLDFEDFEDIELTAEDIAEINAETDAIVAYLAENGITVDVETDEDGVRWPAIDDEDDATWALVDQYFVDTYGEDLEIFEGCDFDEDDFDKDDLDEDDEDGSEDDLDENDLDENDEDDLDDEDGSEDELDLDDEDEDEGEA